MNWFGSGQAPSQAEQDYIAFQQFLAMRRNAPPTGPTPGNQWQPTPPTPIAAPGGGEPGT
mgnify:CR=1 FL=1